MNWIDPVLIKIGPLSIRWYGLMYAFAFTAAYLYLQYSRYGKNLPLNSSEKDNLLIYLILGVLIGGRLGHILFYNLPYYLQNPLKIFTVWEGGMSFHGGLLGVILAVFLFTKKYKINFLKISDTLVLIAPLGIFFGRIGNFINGELYGRISQNFCLYFPTDPLNCRYPSQLFEAFLEGFILFLLLQFIAASKSKQNLQKESNISDGQLTAFFLIFYGIFRSIVEFFREPDAQIGYLFNVITEGQLLSFFMIIGGIILLVKLKKIKEKQQ